MGMAAFDVGRQQSPLNMRLGAAIPVVGVVTWRARGAAGLHGGGWCWKICCNIGIWVWDHLLREAWVDPLEVPPGWGIQSFRVSLVPPLQAV
jgi:hypothetical protein